MIIAALVAHAEAKRSWSVVPPFGATEITDAVRPAFEEKRER